MANYYLVDVGQVIRVLAQSAKDAAWLALLAHPNPAEGRVIVRERDGDDADELVTTFVVADRKCRWCDCTEKRKCKPRDDGKSCHWIEWDLCSFCRVQ